MKRDFTLAIGVGAPRCGTSWLANYFRGHPEVMMSPIKEMNFFNSLEDQSVYDRNMERFLQRTKKHCDALTFEDLQNNTQRFENYTNFSDRLTINRSTDRYLDYFEKRLTDEPVACEITTSYCLLNEHGFEKIRRSHPDIKLILILRNPIDRVWSMVRRRDFSNEKEVYNAFENASTSHRISGKFHYGNMIKNIENNFSKNDYKVVFYENLFSDNQINDICDFLGIGQHKGNFEVKVNSAHSLKLPTDYRKIGFDQFKDVFSWSKETFSDTLPSRWATDIKMYG